MQIHNNITSVAYGPILLAPVEGMGPFGPPAKYRLFILPIIIRSSSIPTTHNILCKKTKRNTGKVFRGLQRFLGACKKFGKNLAAVVLTL